MDNALQHKLDALLQKASAFSWLVEQGRPQGPISGQDPTRCLTFHLAGEGAPGRVEMCTQWRQRLRGGDLATAIQQAHDAAHSQQLEQSVRPFSADTYVGLEATEVPADYRVRFMERAKQSPAAKLPDPQDAAASLSALSQQLYEALNAAQRTEPAAPPDPPKACAEVGPENPVAFDMRGHLVTRVTIEPRWERNVPAEQAERSINEALAAASRPQGNR